MKQFQQLCGLSHFGLNPNEWSILPLKGSHYLIINRYDSQYRFIGQYHNQKWNHLELLSL